jgi:general secretion pathway protein F
MPAFEYQALDGAGKTERGVLEADSPRALRSALRERGLLPVEVNAVKERKASLGVDFTTLLQRQLSAAELTLFTRQLASLNKAGLPLDESLAALADEAQQPRVKRILAAVRAKVVEGHALHSALDGFKGSFPDFYRASVAAGEQAGKLTLVLEKIASFLERRGETAQKLGMAVVYPIILLTVSFAVLIGLVSYVVPQVAQVYTGLKAELPWLTQGVLALSSFVISYGWWLAAGVVLLVIGLVAAPKYPPVRRRLEIWQLRLPVLGPLFRARETARFARTFGILTASGVPMLERIALTIQVMGLGSMKSALQAVQSRVREGGQLSRALAETKQFPPVALRLIASGEKSGELEGMLERIADHQEREVDSKLGVLVALVEPALILLVGGIILLIVLAVLLPVWNLNTLIR